MWPLRIGLLVAISIRKALDGRPMGPVESNRRLLSRFPEHWLDARQPRTPVTIVLSIAGPGGSWRVASRAIGDNSRRNVEIRSSSRDRLEVAPDGTNDRRSTQASNRQLGWKPVKGSRNRVRRLAPAMQKPIGTGYGDARKRVDNPSVSQ